MEDNFDEILLDNFYKKFLAFANYLIKKSVALIFIGIFLVLIGVGLFYNQSPKYEGSLTFLVEEKGSSASGGGLASIASQFGIDIAGGGSGSGLFAGDNILDILKSRFIVERVLLSKIKDRSDTVSLADIFLQFKNYKKKWKDSEYLKNINFRNVNQKEDLSLLQDSVLNLIFKDFTKNNLEVDRLSKKGTIFVIRVASKNEYFSKYASERLVKESRELYINLKTKTAQSNINRLEDKADSLLNLLNQKSFLSADLQVFNPNVAIKKATIPNELAIRDKTILSTIYTEVVKNLETSKMALSQQTPVIQVLDSPSLPLEDNKRSVLYFIFISVFVGGALSLIFYLVKFLNHTL